MDARREIAQFAEDMEAKLRANDSRGDEWKYEDIEYLMDRLTEEVRELTAAVYDIAPAESIAAEAADVANFAMMVAWVAREWDRLERAVPAA